MTTNVADSPTAKRPPKKKAESEGWGYPFGEDGVEGVVEAAKNLAMSRDTLERLAARGKLRIGRHAGNTHRGKMVVCKRSIKMYLATIELT